ncbi:MAG: two-component system, OmpR family, sensor histidine kinase MprB [Baekduia sp.]|nr:two-component system, OmpR family, sensor histidine kinase MprB [Baekduia sp.]
MTIRRRLVLLSTVAVALAIAVAAVAVYVVVRGSLRGQVDAALRASQPKAFFVSTGSTRSAPVGATGNGPVDDHTFSLQSAPGGAAPAIQGSVRVALPPARFGDATGVAQLITPGGSVVAPASAGALPVTGTAREVLTGSQTVALADTHTGGAHLRVLSARMPGGEVLQVARPLTDVDAALGRLRWILAAVMLGGVGLAAALNSRLGRSFNGMIAALEQSREAQRQLVADASHELRTPLTSMRTNLELLARAPGLPATERERIVGSVSTQVEELGVLVGDLVDLARPAELTADETLEDVRLDRLVEEAVAALRAHAPDRELVVHAQPCVVRGSRPRLHRAVRNLLDNAVKWGPPGAPVEIDVRDGQVVVRDHGPGIADADLPLVFDRFYRAPSARSLPGSGLGLAIVRQVAEAHGGTVRAERADGGGARLRLSLSPSS